MNGGSAQVEWKETVGGTCTRWVVLSVPWALNKYLLLPCMIFFFLSSILIYLLFSFPGDKNKIQKLVQMAWTFVNDRYTCSNVDFIVYYGSFNPIKETDLPQLEEPAKG